MSDDGADLNMTAEKAMAAAMGGPEPTRLSDEEFEQRIRTAENVDGYDEQATYAARLVLEFLEGHPEHRTTPIESEGEFQIDGRKATTDELRAMEVEPRYVMVRKGLYDVMKDADVPIDKLDLTGFMWGWAANEARNVLGLDHQPNPAIVEL